MTDNTHGLVSVIIPAYNYGRYIAQAIDSVLAQSYKNYEIIVVDDGSTDNTQQVATAYGDRVKYLHIENGGLSNARNHGARLAKGRYIIYLDADNSFDRDYLRKTVDLMLQQPKSVGYVYTQLQYFGSSDYTTQYPGFKTEYLKVSNFVDACALIRSELVQKYQYDGRYSAWEDWDFYLTLVENGVTGVLLNEPLLNYRKHNDGASMLDRFTAEKRLYSAHRLRVKHWKLYGYVDTAMHWVWYVRMKSQMLLQRSS